MEDKGLQGILEICELRGSEQREVGIRFVTACPWWNVVIEASASVWLWLHHMVLYFNFCHSCSFTFHFGKKKKKPNMKKKKIRLLILRFILAKDTKVMKQIKGSGRADLEGFKEDPTNRHSTCLPSLLTGVSASSQVFSLLTYARASAAVEPGPFAPIIFNKVISRDVPQ